MPYGETEQAKTKEEALDHFRAEMALKKQEEMAKKAQSGGKSYDPHFDDIDPQYLEWGDYETYRDLELMDDGTFRRLRAERLAASRGQGDEDGARHQSIKIFWAYMTSLFNRHTYNRMRLEGKLGSEDDNDR